MNIKVITAEKLNIYNICEGNQIILCQKNKRRTIYQGRNFVVLCPYVSWNSKFKLSNEGIKYKQKNKNKLFDNKYVAEVEEYLSINGKNKILWKRLINEGFFKMWRDENEPLKYYSGKKESLLAIFRIYELPFILNDNNFPKDKNGNKKRNKEVNKEISEKIFNSINQWKPIIVDKEFDRKVNQIKKIIIETKLSF